MSSQTYPPLCVTRPAQSYSQPLSDWRRPRRPLRGKFEQRSTAEHDRIRRIISPVFLVIVSSHHIRHGLFKKRETYIYVCVYLIQGVKKSSGIGLVCSVHTEDVGRYSYSFLA